MWRDCCFASSRVGVLHSGLLALLIVLSGAAAAHAHGASDLERARIHYDAGRSFFNIGRYADAAAQFESGYQIVPKPRFLLNLGHCFNKMGMQARARETYERFLALVPPDDSDRQEVTERLSEIERSLPPAPPPLPPQPVPPPPPEPPPPRIELRPALVVATPAPAPNLALSRFKKWGWTIPVSAVLISGLVVGLTLGIQPSACSSATVDCPTVPR
jgi:tetratricopeptide (TPR) repeat protein